MKYVAFLRGINVGGKNKVPMKDLKVAFERLGHSDVVTYINSGNVIFSTTQPRSSLVSACEDALKTQFGFRVPVAILSAKEMKSTLEAAPKWWGASKDHRHNAIIILGSTSAKTVLAEVGEPKADFEKVDSYKNVIFWSAEIASIGRTRWAKIVSTKAYKHVTIRNSNTMYKVLDLLDE